MRALILLLAAVAGGCVHTHPVSFASAQNRAEVNAQARRSTVIVAVEGRRGRPARNLRVAADSTTWTDFETREPRSAPTASVTAITFRRDGAGALKGAAVGLGAGVATTLLLTGTDCPDCIIPAWVLPSAGGVLGGLAGAAVGATHSDRHTYRPRSSPPAGGVAEEVGAPCPGPPLACAVGPVPGPWSPSPPPSPPRRP